MKIKTSMRNLYSLFLASRTLTLFLALALILSMAGCGRKAAVQPLEPDDYPHTYPKPPPS